MANIDWDIARDILGREAASLDGRNWKEWLDLYRVDAEYWVPAWSDDGRLTDDPQRQISLIYYPGRDGLEDRVSRVSSGRSSASRVLPRTCHQFTILGVSRNADGLAVRSNWRVDACSGTYLSSAFGYADYLLIQDEATWRIGKKRTTLLNDAPDTVLDFYLI